MVIGFQKIHPDAQIPVRKHIGDAGLDICSVEDVKLQEGKPTIVHTGLKVNIPSGYEIQVRPRSGLATKGVTVWNSPGTIDAGYKGEIGVILCYITPFNDETKINYYDIHKGDRIAQLVLAPVVEWGTIEVADVGNSERGDGGFGSTGV